MEDTLPELYRGHAPITLQNAFHDALDAIEGWAPGEGEPEIFLNGQAIPLTRLVGAMARCTDLLPRRSREVAEAIAGTRGGIAQSATFADAARLAAALCRERAQALRMWPALQAARDLECSAGAYAGA